MQKRAKNILVVLTIIIVLIVILPSIIINIAFSYEKSDKVVVEKGQYSFEYRYYESYNDGKRWYLDINGEYTGQRLYPFDDWTHEKMRKHLSNEKLIKILVDEGNVGVCALPLYQYESKYEILYTVDGKNFFEWDEDDIHIEEEIKDEDYQVTKKRLQKLYQYISEDELKKVSEESWE